MQESTSVEPGRPLRQYELDMLRARMEVCLSLVEDHLVRSWPEKGTWRGEARTVRSSKIIDRSRLIFDMLSRANGLYRDDSSPRTVKEEVVKLISSAFILGDLEGAWGPVHEAWPPPGDKL